MDWILEYKMTSLVFLLTVKELTFYIICAQYYTVVVAPILKSTTNGPLNRYSCKILKYILNKLCHDVVRAAQPQTSATNIYGIFYSFNSSVVKRCKPQHFVIFKSLCYAC